VAREKISNLEPSQNTEDVIVRSRAAVTKPIIDLMERAISDQLLNPITGGLLRAFPSEKTSVRRLISTL
jgi:hypothetical protein